MTKKLKIQGKDFNEINNLYMEWCFNQKDYLLDKIKERLDTVKIQEIDEQSLIIWPKEGSRLYMGISHAGSGIPGHIFKVPMLATSEDRYMRFAGFHSSCGALYPDEFYEVNQEEINNLLEKAAKEKAIEIEEKSIDKGPLEEKLKEIEKIFPEIKSRLKPYSYATWGIHWSGKPEDVDYKETEKYQIAASKWEEHLWEEGTGGIKWTEWLKVNYRGKEANEELKEIETEKIVTRDQFDQNKDLNYLWPYNFAKIRVLSDDEIEVWWADKEGNKEQIHKLKLE